MSNLEWFKYEWIWKKTIAANFMNAKLKPLAKHENILIFSNGKTSNNNKNNMAYNPQGIKLTNKKWSRPKKYPTDHKFVRKSHKLKRIIEYEKYPNSILDFPNGNNNNLHSTQKPVKLFEYLIKTYTNKNELVLDSCIGSGTTAIAAINTNRRFIGIEKDEKYFEVSTKRVEDHRKVLARSLINNGEKKRTRSQINIDGQETLF